MIDDWKTPYTLAVAVAAGWQAHTLLPPWWAKRRARKYRCETLDAYWSHEITAQETAKRLASPEANR